MDHFEGKDGAVYERDGSRYYKSTGLTDKKGQPVMTRVSEAVYEAARAAGEAKGPDVQPEPQEAPEKPAVVAQPVLTAATVDVANGICQQDDLTEIEWERLKALFDARIELERMAFQSDKLGLARDPNLKLIYLTGLTQFDVQSTDAAHLYLRQLRKLAKETTRVNRTATSLPENPKYAMHTWLIRLGFIGPEYKVARKVLTAHLPGRASYKNAPKKGTQNDRI